MHCFYSAVDAAGEEEVEFPPVVQDELREEFERERRDLLSRLEDLSTEKENSQQAFDKYREKARDSLMKTAMELRAAESKSQDIVQQLKVLKAAQSVTIVLKFTCAGSEFCRRKEYACSGQRLPRPRPRARTSML